MGRARAAHQIVGRDAVVNVLGIPFRAFPYSGLRRRPDVWTRIGVSTEVNGLRMHSLRAIVAANVLTQGANIGKVHDGLFPVNVRKLHLHL